MSKQRKSKIDQYAAALLQMDGEKQTLDQMLAWLKDEGCVVARSTLAEFLESQRQSRLQARLLSQISTGARQCAEVEKQFGKNPAPEIETLIKLHRVLILQLSTQGNSNPEFLKLADQLTNTVMQFISAQTKAKLEERKLNLQERRVSLLEQKAAAFDRAQEILNKAKSSKGGITPETFHRVEQELNLMP